MKKHKLTCIECPMGCSIEISVEGDAVTQVVGNNCPRGKIYAENEVVCPKRVITSTVRTKDGRIVPVKTDAPVEKAKIFDVLDVINAIHPECNVKIGDVLQSDVFGVNIVATDNSTYNETDKNY